MRCSQELPAFMVQNEPTEIVTAPCPLTVTHFVADRVTEPLDIVPALTRIVSPLVAAVMHAAMSVAVAAAVQVGELPVHACAADETQHHRNVRMRIFFT